MFHVLRSRADLPTEEDEFDPRPSIRSTTRRVRRQILNDPGWYMALLLLLCILTTVTPYLARAAELGLYAGTIVVMLLLRLTWWLLRAAYRSVNA